MYTVQNIATTTAGYHRVTCLCIREHVYKWITFNVQTLTNYRQLPVAVDIH